MPTSQSSGCSQGSKSVRSVTETESEGSSSAAMGAKRVSERADVSAYEGSAVTSGSEEKVPMQPRRDFSWCRDEDGERVFQVTKRGDSVMVEGLAVLSGVVEMGVKVPLPEGVVWAVVLEREEVLEFVSGVELLEARASWEMSVFLS